jgi:hypothetical protein
MLTVDERFDGDGSSPGWLVGRSLFIDPPHGDERIWAIDLAMRCPAFAVVVADGSGLEMAHSRRLQLAAQEGRSLALLARPTRDEQCISAAATRWRVSRVGRIAQDERDTVDGSSNGSMSHDASRRSGMSWRSGPLASRFGAAAASSAWAVTSRWEPGWGPKWQLTLLRCKGRQRVSDHGGPRSWFVEQDRGQGVIRLSAGLVDRSGPPAPASIVSTTGSGGGAVRGIA